MNILVWIVFGAIVGWLTDMVMKSDHGPVEDILLGVFGAFVGGFIMNSLGVTGVTGFNLYSMFVAVLGAAFLVFLGRTLHRR